jgi:hypothetical protein
MEILWLKLPLGMDKDRILCEIDEVLNSRAKCSHCNVGKLCV